MEPREEVCWCRDMPRRTPVTMARLGGAMLAPMKRTMFSWRIMDRLATNSQKRRSTVACVPSKVWIMTSPCQRPLRQKMVLSGDRRRQPSTSKV